jgi:hypothetical protein
MPGKSLFDTERNPANQSITRAYAHTDFDGNVAWAVREGDLKLVHTQEGREYHLGIPPVELYDLEENPPEISEHTFTNFFIWRGSRPLCVRQEGDSLLCAEQREEGIVLFGPPIGPLPTAEGIRCLAESEGQQVLAAERLPEGVLEGVRDEGLEPQSDRDNHDYVYRREDLAELPGRHLASKRNQVQQCLRDHDCAYEELTPDMIDDVRQLQDRWCEERNCGKNPGLCDEYNAIQELLDNWEELRVFGGAVRIEGRLEAYTVGESLNPTTAVVHVEKAMTAFDGLYQVINQWFCREALGDFEYVNREQDLGISGIRRAKKSYHPDHMVRKYRLQLEESMVVPAASEGRCTE